MRVRIPGYYRETLPSGTVRHMVRREGNPRQRTQVPVGHDHPDFWPHYHAARRGERLATRAAPKAPALSLDALLTDYLDHLDAAAKAGRLSPATLRQRRSLLTRAANFLSPEGERMGALHRDLPPEAIEHIRNAWGHRTAQADNCLKALRGAYAWARLPNPAKMVAYTHKDGGGATPWSAADLRQFLARHGEGTTPRLWLILALFTGARIGDLAILGRRHEVTRDGLTWLEWQPGKRGSAPVSLPMMPPLWDATRAMPVIGATYLLTEYGRPFAQGSLGNAVRKWTAAAGLTARTSHGLRKALAEMLAEAGCSPYQIASILAHTQTKTSEVYTRRADRARLARDGMSAIAGVKLW